MSKEKTKIYPDWVEKYRKHGVEIRFREGKYYTLYECSSKYDKEKKCAKKITGKCLGVIKPTGLVPCGTRQAKRKLLIEKPKIIHQKEYGASNFITSEMSDIIDRLKKYFPDFFAEIVIMAFNRLVFQSPLKNMAFHFDFSFLSEIYKDVALNDKRLSDILHYLGRNRESIIKFCQEDIHAEEHILLDITNIHSNSKTMTDAKIGYNSKRDFNPQVNLMMIFSQSMKAPVFYRLLPGNIRDVSAFKLSIQEANIKDAIIVADKGFYSEKNATMLKDEGLSYVIPLHRKSAKINYNLERKKYFKYKDRYIWYFQDKDVISYLENDLKNIEENDYLDRISSCPETHSNEYFTENRSKFGTFTITTNITDKTPDKIYEIYKTRCEVEIMAENLKTTLHADASYMRDNDSMEGWMFVNYVALMWYYRIYNLLSEKELLKTYSPADLLAYLQEIKKVKIGEEWMETEIGSKNKKLFEKFEKHITRKIGS